MLRAPHFGKAAESWHALGQCREGGDERETAYMSAIDLSQGKLCQPAAMNERRESVGNRKIIFETESIEISIKEEPLPEDNPPHLDKGLRAMPEVDPVLYLAPFTPQTPALADKVDAKPTDETDAEEPKTDEERVDASKAMRAGLRGEGHEGWGRGLRKVRPPRDRGKHFVCECGESFIHAASLRIHRLRHTGEPRFQCDVCSKVVTTARSLHNHRLTHVKAFRCKRCPKVFSTQLALDSHLCADTARRFGCVECGAEFTRKAGLEKHAPTHRGEDRERSHVCEQCGKAFYQVGHLLTHRSVHSMDRPFQCDQCDRAFSRNSFLTSHRRTHVPLDEKPRPFVCAVCAHSFMRRCDLNKHELLHSGDRKHLCNVCGKAFSQSGHLASHSAVHTGARPHQCQTCGKSFKRKTALRRHEVTPHAHSPVHLQ